MYWVIDIRDHEVRGPFYNLEDVKRKFPQLFRETRNAFAWTLKLVKEVDEDV